MRDIAVDYKERYEHLERQFEIFTYSVSHDLSAPLRHVREFTKLLVAQLGDDLTEEQKEIIHFIVQGTKKSEAMVEGLLAYSRLNTLRKTFIPFDAEHLFSRTMAGCRDAINGRGATIHLPDIYPTITGDFEQLHDMLTLLLDNAIKFCDEAAQPEISFDIQEQEGGHVFLIKDNGVGIKEKYMDDIFIVFRQLDPESPGVGLGLTLAKKIIERHGGKIWLESEFGKGSIFYVFLPHKLELG